MKTKLSLVIGLLLSAASAFSDGVRGGGDPVGIDFSANTAQAVKDMISFGSQFPGLDLGTLGQTQFGEKVVVVDIPLPVPAGGDVQESTAVNDPNTQTILVNRSKWLAITDVQRKKAIALHETLGLMRIEGTGDYHFTTRYLQLLGSNIANPFDGDGFVHIYDVQGSPLLAATADEVHQGVGQVSAADRANESCKALGYGTAVAAPTQEVSSDARGIYKVLAMELVNGAFVSTSVGAHSYCRETECTTYWDPEGHQGPGIDPWSCNIGINCGVGQTSHRDHSCGGKYAECSDTDYSFANPKVFTSITCRSR